jgi:large subunit ribosomal protein L13
MKETRKIDASGKILGRLATEIAVLLQGKHKSNFSPHLDSKEKIVVTNTSKIMLSSKKPEQKKYYWHSGYPGGIKEVSYKELFKKNPNEVLRRAVYGMLPKNKLRAKMIKNLKLYVEDQNQS